jgi:type II secretory pathway pseudopilin PulG
MEHPPDRAINSYHLPLPIISQGGISLIALIGVLAVITIGLSLVTPALVQIWDRRHQETERVQLRYIADGIRTYLKQNKAFPPSLINLSPDYVPFPSVPLTQNERGYARYYFVHPNISGFDDAIGLSSSELPDARVLLISNLTRDESPTITNAAEFETWWATDESATTGLHINRSNVGYLFHQLTIDQDGNGGSYQVNATATDSGGGPLALHSNYHLTGTSIQFDEADSYSSPEVQFALTTNTTYWFDPTCTIGKKWNPLNPVCRNVRDEFNAIAYNGNDGTVNWVNDWQESGESDGPTSGDAQVVTDAQCAADNCLRLGGVGGATGVIRVVDLSVAVSATLTFSYRRSAGSNGGSIKVQVSDDGGPPWTTLQTYNLNGSDASQVPQSFDLTAYIASTTHVRFIRSGSAQRLFYADNIRIAY